MAFFIGLLRFFFFLIIIILGIGFFSLKRLQRKAREQAYRNQNPHDYQQRHEGEVEVERNPSDEGEYADYEEMK